MKPLPLAIRFTGICVSLLLAAALPAQTSRSVSYSFDYAVTGMGGGVSASQDYTLVAVTDAYGMASPAKSSNELYQMEPTVGSGAAPASVQIWALYE